MEGGLRRQPVPGTRGETGQSTTPRASHLTSSTDTLSEPLEDILSA